MPEIDVAPTEPEVMRQLDTMLAHEAFASKPRQSEFLTFIVTTTLQGGDVSEETIREKMFPSPPYEFDSPIVRRTAGLVRQLVEEYNRIHDSLVIISLPERSMEKKGKGEAYKPTFAYNLHWQITKDYLLGCELLRKTPDVNEYIEVGKIFQNILLQEPDHAGAMVCLAEMFCTADIFADYGAMRADVLDMADELTEKALKLAPRFWRAQAARAVYYCARNRFDLAETYFNEALHLDRDNTESRTFYSIFLVKNHQSTAALELTGRLADQNFTCPTAQTVFGIHLCRHDKLEEAKTAFSKALTIDRNFWYAHMGLAHVQLRLQDLAEAKRHANRARVLLDDDAQYEFWMSHFKLSDVANEAGNSPAPQVT